MAHQGNFHSEHELRFRTTLDASDVFATLDAIRTEVDHLKADLNPLLPLLKEFKVVTICGSMRFFNLMLGAARRLSHDGYIVLMPFVAFPPDEQDIPEKVMLDRMHYAKIDISDAVYVVNHNGYIGESTANEIEYARKAGKQIDSMEPLPG